MGKILWAKSGGQSPDVCDKQVAEGRGLGGRGQLNYISQRAVEYKFHLPYNFFSWGLMGFVVLQVATPGWLGIELKALEQRLAFKTFDFLRDTGLAFLSSCGRRGLGYVSSFVLEGRS